MLVPESAPSTLTGSMTGKSVDLRRSPRTSGDRCGPLTREYVFWWTPVDMPDVHDAQGITGPRRVPLTPEAHPGGFRSGVVHDTWTSLWRLAQAESQDWNRDTCVIDRLGRLLVRPQEASELETGAHIRCGTHSDLCQQVAIALGVVGTHPLAILDEGVP